MSDKNPQICTLAQAQAAAKHLESAKLHVVQTFIPKGNPFGLPEDNYNKFYCFEMFNGAIVNAALVTRVIMYNPGSWRSILTVDITRQPPTGAMRSMKSTTISGNNFIPTTRVD